MTIKERAERAVEIKAQGKNCCQAVVLTLADQQNDLSEDQLSRIAAGFGSGMGNMEGTCGALVGAGMIVSLKTQGQGSKPVAMKVSDAFQAKCGAWRCKELKAKDPETGKVLCSCEDCIRNAVFSYGEVLDLQ